MCGVLLLIGTITNAVNKYYEELKLHPADPDFLFGQEMNEREEKPAPEIDEEELLREAAKWEISHGGMTGRAAQHFIDYMNAMEGLKDSPEMN